MTSSSWEEFAQRSREPYEQQAARTKTWIDGQGEGGSGIGGIEVASGVFVSNQSQGIVGWLAERDG